MLYFHKELKEKLMYGGKIRYIMRKELVWVILKI